jgi:hypothetical protein
VTDAIQPLNAIHMLTKDMKADRWRDAFSIKCCATSIESGLSE